MNDVVLWNYICENPSKVLFIFDGIDEYSARKKIEEDDSIYKNTVEDKSLYMHCTQRLCRENFLKEPLF